MKNNVDRCENFSASIHASSVRLGGNKRRVGVSGRDEAGGSPARSNFDHLRA